MEAIDLVSIEFDGGITVYTSVSWYRRDVAQDNDVMNSDTVEIQGQRIGLSRTEASASR
jgi:hypothetical protein